MEVRLTPRPSGTNPIARIRDDTRRLAFVLSPLVAFFACGCARTPINARYMQPELLYLNASPSRSLYVEVDAIEG
ncbi:MAG: hypothetical protein ABFE01_27450, partial [Phycisphaerales bacterium]